MRINVCGLQGNRYTIHPVIDKYLPADVAEPLLRFHEWTPEQISDVIVRLSQGRKAKAKDQCIGLLQMLAGRAGIDLESLIKEKCAVPEALTPGRSAHATAHIQQMNSTPLQL